MYIYIIKNIYKDCVYCMYTLKAKHQLWCAGNLYIVTYVIFTYLKYILVHICGKVETTYYIFDVWHIY